jgi:hypothetical protein
MQLFPTSNIVNNMLKGVSRRNNQVSSAKVIRAAKVTIIDLIMIPKDVSDPTVSTDPN